jgi:hypothetical protein
MRPLAILALLIAPWATGQPVRIRTSELPWAIVGQPYQASFEIGLDGRCIGGGVELSLAEGELPRGLALRGDGLAGIPAATGTFPFSVRAANGCGSVVRPLELVVTGKPILRATPGEIVFECQEGGPPPEPQTVLVASSWPGLPYTVRASQAPWLAYEPAAGRTPEPGAGFAADAVALRVDPAKLAPGVYHTILRVWVWQGANAPSVAVTFKVLK